MKKILVPTDFSETAQYATRAAAVVAKKTGATVELLHAVQLPVDWVRLESSTMIGAGKNVNERQEMYPEFKQVVEAAKSKMKEASNDDFWNGVDVTTHVSPNLDHKGIVHHAELIGADLIVMGSHGSSGFQEMFLGSNAQKVVRFSAVPVLVVKDDQEEFSVSNIIFASDFEADAIEPFEKVKNFAMEMGAAIDLLYVNTPYKFESSTTSKKKMKVFFDKCPKGMCSMSIFNETYEEKGVMAFTEEVNADMIAMVTHGRTGLTRALSGSHTEYVINHAKQPVLSINLKKG